VQEIQSNPTNEMTYELAKQLKDAGFPNMQWMGYLTSIGIESFEKDKHGPTLSELIEACGTGFGNLILGQNRNLPPLWKATAAGAVNEERFNLGSTPEEAVAKLWLALNRK
jgi:hypothetical protein